MMPEVEKSSAIENIVEDITACERCRGLSGVGNMPVFPRGNPHAHIMLVGEGPGEQEEKQRRPFVGSAGKLLEETLKDLGFDIENDLYITNIVKYRSYKPLPSGKKKNKPPTVKQINNEREFLEREIAVVKPKLIVALGAKSSRWFLGKDFKLTEERGKFYNWHGITILPTYHPAAILRAYAAGAGEDRMSDFKNDLRRIKEIIGPEVAA